MAERDSPTEMQLQSRLAHLTMVQAIIGRIAGYSATLKNFNLTIAAALIAVAFEKTLVGLLFAGAGITVVFALLDAYYLSLERCFRDCYAMISARPWSDALNLSITQRPARPSDVIRSMKSVSVWGFYLPLLGGVLLLAYLLSYVQPGSSETDISPRSLGTHVAAERTVAASERHIAEPTDGSFQRAPAVVGAPGGGALDSELARSNAPQN